MDAFTAIDRYFAAFVCGTYLLFTAILSINIFIGLISNALQTEAFSTVEARFLLERVEVILNYEWRFSKRKRSQIQEIIHRHCSPLQLNWKDINFDAYGQSREDQQAKVLTNVRQTMDKQNVQFDTFRIHLQQKLNDIDAALGKIQNTSMKSHVDVVERKSTTSTPRPSRRPSSIHAHIEQIVAVQQSQVNDSNIGQNHNEILGEIARVRELLEETIANRVDRTDSHIGVVSGSTSSDSMKRPSTIQPPVRHSLHIDKPHRMGTSTTTNYHQVPSSDLNERVTDLQLAVNRLHQDVSAIRQVIERISPLSTSLILGRIAGRK
jgi:hypothetical protein